VPERVPAAEQFEKAARGDRAALAYLISAVERGGDLGHEVARHATARPQHAFTIGVTGAGGSGKSTLTSALVEHMRDQGCGVAVLAIDPSSPITGGAFLGDRVRMHRHTSDPAVYIRSLATRGAEGGLAIATSRAISVLAAAGWPWILVETVGVGQVDVEVARRVDTTVVVVTPGAGDAVQANKAGLLETADVYVVNKADLPGADQTRRDLETTLHLAHRRPDAWCPPICETIATSGAGVAAMWGCVRSHAEFLESSGVLRARREQRRRGELRDAVLLGLRRYADAIAGSAQWAAIEAEVAAGVRDPEAAAAELLRLTVGVTGR
jgi:LAO/AO transport system kinase